MDEAVGDVIAKGKITVKCLINARKVTFLPEGQNRLYLGDILGTARSVVVKTDAKGDSFEGLAGSFEARNAETGEVTVGGICYLPGGFQELVVEALQAAGDHGSVGFSYMVYAEKANNPAGYSYAMRPAYEAARLDPLAELRARLSAMRQKALAAPVGHEVVAPQVEGKGKGKAA